MATVDFDSYSADAIYEAIEAAHAELYRRARGELLAELPVELARYAPGQATQWVIFRTGKWDDGWFFTTEAEVRWTDGSEECVELERFGAVDSVLTRLAHNSPCPLTENSVLTADFAATQITIAHH